MISPGKETEEPSSSGIVDNNDAGSNGAEIASTEDPRPPAKRPISDAVIEISDTESDDSDVCAVNTYQATADEVKRIRGADYSSSSSSLSSDYSSDSESPWDDDSILLEDEQKGYELVRAELNPRANRMDDPKINSKLKSQDLIETLASHWKDLKDHRNDDITLTCEPFRVCLLHNLLENPEIINNIVDDMNTLDWTRKKMDLFEFHQTDDLANLTWQRSIRGIYELLKTDVMTWVSLVTGLQLTSVSASCSLYGPGDHLLIHDDLLGDRRVAFIIYLAPWKPNTKHYRVGHPVENGAEDHNDVDKTDVSVCGWGAHMGGALELISHNEVGHPTDVVRRIYPRNNMLAFFKVTTDSFHQVGEVLSLELPRLSINGWFHGPAPEPEEGAEPRCSTPPASFAVRPHAEVVVLNQWVDSAYMSPRSRAQVQQQMETASEVCLRDFLLHTKYEELLQALNDTDIPWESRSSVNPRHGRYSRVPAVWAETLHKEHALRGLLKLLSGTGFFKVLTDCTDLTFTTYEHLEIQRWSPGDFTLIPSRVKYQNARLEAVIYLGVPPHPLCGGTTTFVAPEDREAPAEDSEGGALITLPPQNNALNLVYCDAGVASFTKYLSKMTMRDNDYFYIVTCTYKE